MNNITTVLVILLVIVLIIAGGGYLYKANEVLRGEITDLNTTITDLEIRNSNLESELALEKNKNSVLSQQNLDLSQTLNETRTAQVSAQLDVANEEDRQEGEQTCTSPYASNVIQTAGIGSSVLIEPLYKIEHIFQEIPTSVLLLVFLFLTVALAILLTAVMTSYMTTQKGRRIPNYTR